MEHNPPSVPELSDEEAIAALCERVATRLAAVRDQPERGIGRAELELLDDVRRLVTWLRTRTTAQREPLGKVFDQPEPTPGAAAAGNDTTPPAE